MPVNQLPDEVQKQRAMDLLNQGRVEDARALLAELCRENQRNVGIWLLYSTASGHLGHFEDVVTACHKALEIEPDFLPALNSLASALAALGRHEEAEETFTSLLRLAPNNPAVLNNYGHAMALMGRLEEARKALEDAVSIQPHYAEARYNLAILLEESGQPAEALREYEQAAALKPGLPDLDDRMNRLREIVT